MKKLRYVSDLHLEYLKTIENDKLAPLYTIPNNGDEYYLALLGDIGNPYRCLLKRFLKKVSQIYVKIYYVPGNHEYYSLEKIKNIDEIKKDLITLCDSFHNVILLDNTTDSIGCFKIIGTTLWSNIDDKSSKKIKWTIKDYKLIYKNGANIEIADTNNWNSENIKFIEKELQCDKKCIVLTHHAPLFSNAGSGQFTSNPKHINSKTNKAFHNNLSHLFNNRILAWIYGHTHYCNYFKLNNVIVATNQLGYDIELNTCFDSLREILLD